MAGLCCRQVVPSGPAQVQTCHVGSRPVPGGGAVGYYVPFGWSGLFRCLGAQRPGGPRLPGGGPHFSREMGRKRAGGKPPGPPVLWPARSHSLVLAWWGALFRWWGCFGAHLRALIWIRILREQGLGEKAFRCGDIPPTKASPWGEAVTEGD